MATLTDIEKSLETFNSSVSNLEKAYDKISRKIEEYEHNEIVPREYLEELAGNLAHEIRNPLSVISSLVELLVQNKSGADTRGIQGILDGVRRIDKVVENLIIFSRPINLKPIDCNFRDLLFQAIETVKTELGEDAGDYEFATSIPAGDIYVRTDPVLMLQAIQNLLHNAAEIMGEGGKIELEIGISQPGRLTLTISDQGPGLAGGNTEKPFYPFFTTKTYGMGLGLPTARLIIDKHGGKVWLANRPPQGVVATVELPTS